MKVTGWTYYDNTNFINIEVSCIKARVEATKNVTKIPKAKEVYKYSKKELNDIIDKHSKEFLEALDNEKIHELNRLRDDIINTVIEDIRKNKYHFSGELHQYGDYCTPIVDDKYILCLSQREWGGIIAKAFPEEFEKDDEYAYIRWAWGCGDNSKYKTILPDKSLWKNDAPTMLKHRGFS